MTVREADGSLRACAPVYLKGHSMGEYVFDHGWADAARRAGLRYYPKVLVAVPFTPVEGGRLLLDAELGEPEAAATRQAMAATLVHFCDEAGFSSVHVNFCTEPELPALDDAGFLTRLGFQYRWVNDKGWESWDNWLAALRSKRRKETRRERRQVASAGLTVRTLTDDEVTPERMATMFRLYEHHLRHYGGWGRRYLTPELFELLTERWRHRLALTIAQPTDAPESEPVAGALHIRKGDALYGRYWGAFADVPGLHFECCYYAPIEHCLDHGIHRFEAGAQGDHKRSRGLDSQVTYSMHHLAHPGLRAAVADHLAQERIGVTDTVEFLRTRTALRREQQTPDEQPAPDEQKPQPKK